MANQISKEQPQNPPMPSIFSEALAVLSHQEIKNNRKPDKVSIIISLLGPF